MMKSAPFTKRALLLQSSLAGFGLAAAAPAPAVAQDDAGARRLDEIVVTSRRKEESLQDAPVSVTAIEAEALDQFFADDLTDLNGIAPNVVVTNVTGFNAAAISFRGTSTGDIILTFDPAVGVVIDDFPIAHVQTQLLDLFDIERIEFLRGPQGTTFGKNTVGGVINVATKLPDMDRYGAEARFLYGNFDTQEVRAAVNMPLIEDTLAMRTAILYQRNDGFYRNAKGDGRRFAGDDVFSLRSKLLWTPTSRTDVLFTFEYLRDRGGTPGNVNETPEDFAFSQFGFPGIQTTGADPFDTGVTLCEGDRFDPDCIGTINGHQVDVYGGYLRLNHQFDIGTLTVIGGHRYQQSVLPSDFSGEVARLFESTRDDIRRQYMIESRFASTLEGPLNFIVGGQYWSNDLDYVSSSFLSFLTFLGDPTATSDPNLGGARHNVDSFAFFGEAEYEIAPAFDIIFGMRYTNESKDFERQPQVRRSLVELGQQPTFEESANFDAITLRAGWRYQITDDVSSYFTFSQGFKSGGFNSQAMTAFSAQPFNEETADSFELGLKSELFDNRLRFNASGFYVKYDDLQRESVLPFIDPLTNLPGQETVTSNAGGARVYGLEFEALAVPTQNLTLQGSLGWQDAEYTEFQTDIDGDGINDDASFLELTRVPTWTVFGSATYEAPINYGRISANLNVSYQSEFEFSVLNADFTQGEARTLFNTSLTWFAPDDAFQISGFARNLFDERYRVSGNSVAGLWNFTNYGAPRTYCVEVGANF
ncbi:MAG: TonB-dependent receptor [Pseudomonadota bacterium]